MCLKVFELRFWSITIMKLYFQKFAVWITLFHTSAGLHFKTNLLQPWEFWCCVFDGELKERTLHLKRLFFINQNSRTWAQIPQSNYLPELKRNARGNYLKIRALSHSSWHEKWSISLLLLKRYIGCINLWTKAQTGADMVCYWG